MAEGDTDVSICSQALLLLGANQITSFADGTAPSSICSVLYPRVKAQTLGMYPWSFTLTKQQIGRLTTAPTNVYLYAYQLPSDMFNGVPRAVYASLSTGTLPKITEYEIQGDQLFTNKTTNVQISNYKSFEKKELVKNKKLIDQNIAEQKFKVIDARSKERFEGKIPEPRKGLRSGSIKNSFCIPFSLCLNEDKTFKNKEELQIIFKTCLENIDEKNIVFSCGSGVTACVLALAYSLINDKYHPCIYDGSWAEYGII